MLFRSSEARHKLVDTAIKLIKDESMQEELKKNISKMAINDSAERIAKEIYSIVG